jgi:hypothetical protein
MVASFPSSHVVREILPGGRIVQQGDVLKQIKIRKLARVLRNNTVASAAPVAMAVVGQRETVYLDLVKS